MQMSNVRHMPRMGFADASRHFGLTPRALRFYEDIGLVEAGRDRLNHRFYDARNRERLAWISRLRSAGVGLRSIGEVLEAGENGEDRELVAREKLEERLSQLERELRRVQSAMVGLALTRRLDMAPPINAGRVTA
jgi:DNA-binding transcriptional MerR regulator